MNTNIDDTSSSEPLNDIDYELISSDIDDVQYNTDDNCSDKETDIEFE